MRAVTVTLASLLVGLSQAQTGSVPGLPDCASGCIGNFGGCGALDADCICNNSDLISNLACCVSVNCDEQDQDTTLTFANGICQGYDADLPQTATCAPGAQSTPAGGSTAAGSASSSGSAASASSTSGGSSSSMSGSSMASGSSSSSGNEFTPTPGPGATAVGGGAVGTATASASASETPNVGGKVEGRVGLGMVVAGLLAAI